MQIATRKPMWVWLENDSVKIFAMACYDGQHISITVHTNEIVKPGVYSIEPTNKHNKSYHGTVKLHEWLKSPFQKNGIFIAEPITPKRKKK